MSAFVALIQTFRFLIIYRNDIYEIYGILFT